MPNIRINFLLSISLFLAVAASPAIADEHSDALKKYLTDDVVAVAYIDIGKLDPDAIVNQVKQLGLVGSEIEQLEGFAVKAKSELKQLTGAGIQYVYALIRSADVNDGGTSWVIPVANGNDLAGVTKMLKALVSIVGMPELVTEFRDEDGVILAASNEGQLERLTTARPTQVRDLSAAWKALGSGTAGVIVFGDSDSRRVVREMFPALPAPFELVTGKMVADDLKWGGIELGLPPNLKVKMEIEATDSDSIEIVNRALQNGISTLGQLPQFQSLIPESERAGVLAALQPVSNKTRTTVSLDAISDDLDRLIKVLAGPISGARKAAQVTQEKNNVRQLVLAMHNYESVHRHFPSPDGKSERTPAGLSWRVHVLPFLEEMELYKQFKLDEPWDSEHNLELVKHMPQLYKSPMTSHSKPNDEGKTIYQVPISGESIFQPDADHPVSFSEITDGSSNTVLIVTVAPDKAVIWTRPADWKVDLGNPWIGLKDDQRESVNVALADGSVHAIPISVKPETLRAMITQAGGEVVNWDFD